MYGVAPQNVELHSLRRLLSVVKGATSFADLATVVSLQHLSSSCCSPPGRMAAFMIVFEARYMLAAWPMTMAT
jgi:hypothetical protein